MTDRHGRRFSGNDPYAEDPYQGTDAGRTQPLGGAASQPWSDETVPLPTSSGAGSSAGGWDTAGQGTGRGARGTEDRQTLTTEIFQESGEATGPLVEQPTEVIRPGRSAVTSGGTAGDEFAPGTEYSPTSSTRVIPAAEAPDAGRSRREDAAAPATAGRGGYEEPVGFAPYVPGPDPEEMRREALVRQKREFGRIQLLPGLIGWLAALGMLQVLATAAAAVLGALGQGDSATSLGAAVQATGNGQPGDHLVLLVVLGVVYFLAFLFGGYAAGRAGRFAGAKQGVAVWLWQLMGTAVATVLGLVLGASDQAGAFFGSVQSLGADQVLWGAVTAAAVLLLGLVAAVLGGLWGTRFHRTVDRFGSEGR